MIYFPINNVNCFLILHEQVSLSSLTNLGMHSIGSKVVFWHNPLLERSFYLHNLRNLQISDLDELKYLFTAPMVNTLLQLETLVIKNCKLMEVVIVSEEKWSTTKFPNLNQLHLDNLPKLTRFSGNSMDLSSLSNLWIKNCPKMKMFISYSYDKTENSQYGVQPFFDEKVPFPSFFLLLFFDFKNF